jgi:hypothetical protein
MRQAMTTLTRQLHAPDPRDGIYRWSIAALHRGNFEAMLVFHYTVTAINELREPLRDEVCTRLFRVEADRLAPVEDAFAATVLRETTCPVKPPARRDEWVRLFRGRWPGHRRQLEPFRQSQEEACRTDLQARGDAARLDAASRVIASNGQYGQSGCINGGGWVTPGPTERGASRVGS